MVDAAKGLAISENFEADSSVAQLVHHFDADEDA